MEVAGTFEIKAAREKVWDYLKNPANMQPCIPGCQVIEESSPGRYRTVIGVKLGPIAPTFNLEVTVTEEVAPSYIACSISGEEGGRASRVTATSEFKIATIDDTTTRVSYYSKSDIVGRLGKYGSGIMKKKADQLWSEIADRLRSELESADGGATVAPASRPARGSSVAWWSLGFILLAVVAWWLFK